jgi:hypothetical protein
MSKLIVDEIVDSNGNSLILGSVLQVQYTESNTVVDISAQDIVPITGLSVNISPISATSKILLEANIVTNAYYVSSFGFALGTTAQFTRLGGNTNTNSVNAISTLFSYGDTLAPALGENMYSVTYRYLYTQTGSPSPLTFHPCACSSWSGQLFNLRINDRLTVSATNTMRSTSSITATEIVL